MTIWLALLFFLCLSQCVVVGWLLFRIKKLKSRFEKAQEDKRVYQADLIELREALSMTETINERTLIDLSSYLHDEVGSNLSSVKLLLYSLTRTMTGLGKEVAIQIDKHLTDSIQQVRVISRNLHPPSLRDRKSTRLNSSHVVTSRMPSSA